MITLAWAYHATPTEFLSRVNSAELAELLAAHRMGLISDPARDAAAIRATIVNMLGEGKRHFTPADFLPDFTPPRSQTAAEQRSILAAFAARIKPAGSPQPSA